MVLSCAILRVLLVLYKKYSMSDNVTQNDTEQEQNGQKTIVAFIVGLLIGGLVVWMFSGTPSEAPDNGEPETEETETVDDEAVDEEDDLSENDQAGRPTAPSENDQPQHEMQVGEGSVEVSDQPAGSRVALDAVTFPMSDGWIGVREFSNEDLGAVLGVMRFGESEGLIPEEIILQRATTPGNDYAIVFFTASHTNEFNLALNSQVEGIFATFTAQ